MILFLIQVLTAAVHVSTGPHGFVAWVQPPHLAAGIGVVSGHLATWWQVQ